MPISNDDVKTLLQRTASIEQEQKRHGRTLYGDSEGEWPGLRTLVLDTKRKADAIDDKITAYEQRIQGAKWVIGGFVFLLTSGAVATLINLLSGG